MYLADLYRRGEHAAVVQEVQRLRAVGPAEDALTAAATWYYGAMSHYRLGQLLPSVSLMERALEESEVAGNPTLLGKVRFQAGEAYRRAGRISEALHWTHLFLADLDQYPDLSRYRALANYNLGLAYRQHGDLERSIAHYETAEALFHEIGDGPWLIRALNNLTFILTEHGQYDSARSALERSEAALSAFDLAEDLGELHHGRLAAEAFLLQRTGHTGAAMSICESIVTEGSGAAAEQQLWATWIAAECALDMHEPTHAETLLAAATRTAAELADTRALNYITGTRRRLSASA